MPGLEIQIKEGFEKVQNEFTTFKQENDLRLKKLEAVGHVPGDIEGKITKHSEAITQMEEKLDKQISELKVTMNRAGGAGADGMDKKEVEKKMSGIMNGFLRNNIMSPEDRKFFEANIPAEMKSLSVGSDPTGGYFVNPTMSNEIGQKVYESSPIRELASSVTIGSDAWEEPADYDEVTVEEAGESTSHATTDTMDFSMVRIPTHQLQAKPDASLKVLEDASIDLEAYLTMKVSEKFARTEATQFVSGTGVTGAKGFLSYDSGDAFNKIEQVTGTVSAGIAADDLVSLQNALFEVFQSNATWLMRRATATYIRKLKDGEGRYLLSMEGNLRDGYQNILLGRPVRFAADMPAIAASALAVAYGDFKRGYLIVDRLGMSVLRDPYSSDNKIVWKFRKRQGGGVRQFQAIKLLDLA